MVPNLTKFNRNLMGSLCDTGRTECQSSDRNSDSATQVLPSNYLATLKQAIINTFSHIAKIKEVRCGVTPGLMSTPGGSQEGRFPLRWVP